MSNSWGYRLVSIFVLTFHSCSWTAEIWLVPRIVGRVNVERLKLRPGTSELFGPGGPGALARKGDTDEVAVAVVFLLTGESSFVNGVVLPVDGGSYPIP